MRAELKQDGTLVVSAETGTEAFALAAWQARYGRGPKEFRTTLETVTAVPPTTYLGTGTLTWPTVPYSNTTLLADSNGQIP